MMKLQRTNILRTLLFLATLLGGLSQSAQAGAYALSAQKKKVDTQKKQGVFHPRTEKKVEQYCYEVAIHNRSPQNATQVQLQYIVYRQDPFGKIEKAVYGTQHVNVPVGTPVRVTTNPFELS